MNKNVILILGVAVLLALGGLLFSQTPAEAPTEEENGNDTTWPRYTLDEVAMHDSEEDCWMALDGDVLEISQDFIGAHPGGRENILRGCGKDISEMFRMRPTNPPTEHSTTAFDLAASFKIGELSAE